jgi:hypothetical protein
MQRRSVLKGLGLALLAPIPAIRTVAEGSELDAKVEEYAGRFFLSERGGRMNDHVRIVVRAEDAWGDVYGLALRIVDKSRGVLWKQPLSLHRPEFRDIDHHRQITRQMIRMLVESVPQELVRYL